MNQEEGNYPSAREAFDLALAIARREGDEALEMRTLTYAAQADGHQGHYEAGLQEGLQAIEMASRLGDLHCEAMAHWSVTLYLRRDPRETERVRYHIAAMLAAAERLRDRYLLVQALWLNETLAYRMGDWPGARRFSDSGSALSSDPRLLATRALLEYAVGEFTEGKVYLDRLLGMIRRATPGPTMGHALTALVVPIIARITGAVPGLEAARAAGETVLSLQPANRTVAMPARVGLALQAMLDSNVTAAEEHYEALSPWRGLLDLQAGIPTDRMLGLLAKTMGRLDQGIVHFEAAYVLLKGGSHRPELAWTCCDYADALLQRNNPGDREKAISLLEESVAISRELGMRPLMERVVTLQE